MPAARTPLGALRARATAMELQRAGLDALAALASACGATSLRTTVLEPLGYAPTHAEQQLACDFARRCSPSVRRAEVSALSAQLGSLVVRGALRAGRSGTEEEVGGSPPTGPGHAEDQEAEAVVASAELLAGILRAGLPEHRSPTAHAEAVLAAASQLGQDAARAIMRRCRNRIRRLQRS